MQTNADTPRAYSRAFAIRARMVAFRADLLEQPSWRLASTILFDRFELVFGFFLDAPTANRLDRIVAFEAEMDEIAARLPELRWPHRERRRAE
jgi:hypothetical protein